IGGERGLGFSHDVRRNVTQRLRRVNCELAGAGPIVTVSAPCPR
ncbi:MAG: hypothetical protein JWM35_2779, partial [Verrucomicrobia bacterium]|nr:hypothetical protein [Verrucomicrobiota bacterium]